MGDETRIPDIEVIVQAAGSDLAVICFYRGKTVHDDFEVVAGIEDKSDIPNLVTTLIQATKALYSQDWFSVDELDPSALPDEKHPPF